MKKNGQGDALPPYYPKRGRAKIWAIAAWLVFPPQWILGLFRTFWPIPSAFGWAAVTRYDDVAEVLTRSDVFEVPFGAEIARLNDGEIPGTPFLLGIDDKAAHERQLKLLVQAFKREDAENCVKPVSFKFATEKVGGVKKNGSIDAIQELITAVPLEVCRKYFGVEEIEDPQKFADATIDVSGHLFGFPPINPDPDIDKAAAYMRAVVNRAIKREIDTPSRSDTVLARLVKRYQHAELTREHVRAFLIGMIVGFVPTNTMSGGHILEMLLQKKKFMKAARAAVEAGDDDLLKHCLFEAMRFKPHNIGVFRVCSGDHTIAADTSRAKTIKSGTKVLASTLSAMFDPRQLNRPGEFNPRRPASDYMLFGYGMHWCAGVYIAQAQITQMFKAMLARPGLRPARGASGRMKLRGLFPDHLHVQWDPEKC